MKKEHFITALETNDVPILKHTQGEVAGIMKHSEFISSTYYEGDEVVSSFQLMIAPVASKVPKTQLKHITDSLRIFNIVSNLLTNVDGTSIMRSLGAFTGKKFEPGHIIKDDFIYRIDHVQGLLLLTIAEIEPDTPLQILE